MSEPDSRSESVSEEILAKQTLQFRSIIQPKIVLIQGLAQAWNCFLCTEEMAKYFYLSFESIPYQSKTALTKAIIVEYIKPWQKNNGQALSLVRQETKFAFLKQILSKSEIHKSLNELRQRLVAHTNEDYESISFGFRGAEIPNEPDNQERAPKTLQKVRIPVVPVIKSVRGIWWINNRDKVGDIQKHASECKDATQLEIRRQTKALRDVCLSNMHIPTVAKT